MMSICQTRLLNQAHQRGFSLIELMVATTISLILLAGVGNIYLSNVQSYKLQNGTARMQENARYALDILARNIAMSGYSSSTSLDAFNSANTLENNSADTNMGFTVAAGTASDTISINYTSTTDCLGNATAGTATDYYYIDGSKLMCLGNGNATAGIIAEGIDNMQILYGEDTNNDNVPDKFVDAGTVSDWDTVVTVRIAILASSMESVGTNYVDAATHVLLDAPSIGPLNDHMLRRVFIRTVARRNLNI